MPWTSSTPVLVWLVIFLPTSFLLIRWNIKDRLTYILLMLAYAAYNLYAVLTVNFLLIDYYLRLLPVVVLAVSLFRFLVLPRHKRWLPSKELHDSKVPGIVSGVVILAMVYPDLIALRSYNFSNVPYKAVLSQWPLQTGLYVIVNGGNGLKGLGMNDGYMDWLGRETRPSDYRAFETDIMKMTSRGMVGDRGPFPALNDGYIGFLNHDPVYAPCPGRVVYVEDGHRDVQPFGAPEAELGNRVVVQCFEFYITLANLRNGSIPVREGQRVDFNSQIGQIGNSGAPGIPHLKVFADVGAWNEQGTPVPINFEFNYPVRNMVYIGQK